MKNAIGIGALFILVLTSCDSKEKIELTETEKQSIRTEIQKEIDELILAVSHKDIETYMNKMPKDFIIYDDGGEIITREQQKEYALRDWSIIEKTLSNEMRIDSIDFVSPDSIFVFTFQKWKRMMFQRDGVTKDTVLTTQYHRELWKKDKQGWVGYDVLELGGEIFINGEKYTDR